MSVKFKLCDKCNRTYEAEKFTDPRRRQTCDFCVAELNREEKTEKAKKEAERTFAEILDLAHVKISELPRIEEMCGGVVDAYGGMNLFCRDVADYMKELMAAPRKSSATAQVLLRFIDLVSKANEHQRRVAADQMNQESIREEQKRMLIQLLMESASDPHKRETLVHLLNRDEFTENLMKDALAIEGVPSDQQA